MSLWPAASAIKVIHTLKPTVCNLGYAKPGDETLCNFKTETKETEPTDTLLVLEEPVNARNQVITASIR